MYPFVGKTYVHQWTLQNTTLDFKYVLHFSTDSTFSLNPIKVDTGESMRDKPAEGMYEVKADGTIEFYGVSLYLTRIRGQRVHTGTYPLCTVRHSDAPYLLAVVRIKTNIP